MIVSYVLLHSLCCKTTAKSGKQRLFRMSEFLLPDEPIRFTTEAFDRMLLHCVNLSASDITLQTNTSIFVEVHGRLIPVTTRKLSNTEVGDMLNAIYGSNGTTQIYSGKD